MLTKRQNLLETIKGGNPDRFVNQYEALVCQDTMFGMIMGDAGVIPDSPDTTDLMQNVRTANNMYRLYFQGSGPPAPHPNKQG